VALNTIKQTLNGTQVNITQTYDKPAFKDVMRFSWLFYAPAAMCQGYSILPLSLRPYVLHLVFAQKLNKQIICYLYTRSGTIQGNQVQFPILTHFYF
jgi:hypothetical protein